MKLICNNIYENPIWSFAIAGYFKLKIYIASLNSPAMDKDNLGNLFADLPKKCLVLLEDIDTAGLTHTREEKQTEEAKPVEIIPGPGATVVATPATTSNSNNGRITIQP
jgi:chaperone BCS1